MTNERATVTIVSWWLKRERPERWGDAFACACAYSSMMAFVILLRSDISPCLTMEPWHTVGTGHCDAWA